MFRTQAYRVCNGALLSCPPSHLQIVMRITAVVSNMLAIGGSVLIMSVHRVARRV